MAITVENYGPKDHLPNLALNEWQYLRLVGDGTAVMVPAGAGLLARVYVGVAGTLATFYDTPSGGTADGTTSMANLATSVTGLRFEGPIAFSKGLTLITTGANTDLTIVFRGRAIPVTSRSFGS